MLHSGFWTGAHGQQDMERQPSMDSRLIPDSTLCDALTALRFRLAVVKTIIPREESLGTSPQILDDLMHEVERFDQFIEDRFHANGT